jgi:hypothetical protein
MKNFIFLFVFVLFAGMAGAHKDSVEPVLSERAMFGPYDMIITNKTVNGFDYHAVPADLLSAGEYINIQVYEDTTGDPLTSPSPIVITGGPNFGHVSFSTTASNLNYFGQIDYNGTITTF